MSSAVRQTSLASVARCASAGLCPLPPHPATSVAVTTRASEVAAILSTAEDHSTVVTGDLCKTCARRRSCSRAAPHIGLGMGQETAKVIRQTKDCSDLPLGKPALFGDSTDSPCSAASPGLTDWMRRGERAPGTGGRTVPRGAVRAAPPSWKHSRSERPTSAWRCRRRSCRVLPARSPRSRTMRRPSCAGQRCCASGSTSSPAASDQR